MIRFFRRKNDWNIYSPVSGKYIDITQVNDPAFSSMALGDGFAVIPADTVIAAPCDGELSMIFQTGHAFGIKADNGAEVLIHIGIDTVNTNGDGFRILKEVNSRVKKGDPVISFDSQKLRGYDTTTMVIITNQNHLVKKNIGQFVHCGDSILEIRQIREKESF